MRCTPRSRTEGLPSRTTLGAMNQMFVPESKLLRRILPFYGTSTHHPSHGTVSLFLTMGNRRCEIRLRQLPCRTRQLATCVRCTAPQYSLVPPPCVQRELGETPQGRSLLRPS